MAQTFLNTTAAYSVRFRIQLPNRPGMFARVANVIAAVGGDLGVVEIVQERREDLIREITVRGRDLSHLQAIVSAVKAVEGIEVQAVADMVYALHEGGKIGVSAKKPITSPADLARLYTPGVARVCQEIYEHPLRSFTHTLRGNTVAVVTDGTAVLGLGDIGPLAALPVMEGKAALFKEFGGVDAFPICLNTQDPQAIVETVARLAPTFGGINLEDISAPRCFEIEERLQAAVDIPVFHDDQHGTAIVALAALKNAVRLVGKSLPSLKVVICGVGAAGVACAKLFMAAGIRHIIGCDRQGALYAGRTEHMNPVKEWFAQQTNPERRRGDLGSVIEGADVFLGVSGPRVLRVEDVKKMAPGAIVFALSNPIPEIMPEEASPHVAIMATGRSDYPNQINNVLAFPGVFRGALDCRARQISEGMKLAAVDAIASLIPDEELSPERIIPSVFDRRVAPRVAEAVRNTAIQEGWAEKTNLSPQISFEEIRY